MQVQDQTNQSCILLTSSSLSSKQPSTLLQGGVGKTQNKMTVTFDPKVRTRKTIAINDMTKIEIHDTWLSKNDQIEILKTCKQEMIDHSNCCCPSNINTTEEYDGGSSACCEGLMVLESLTLQATERKGLNRYEAAVLVLDEQDQQYLDEGTIYDEEHIKSLYQEVSNSCQIQAEYRALQYQKEVERYQKEYLPVIG